MRTMKKHFIPKILQFPAMMSLLILMSCWKVIFINLKSFNWSGQIGLVLHYNEFRPKFCSYSWDPLSRISTCSKPNPGSTWLSKSRAFSPALSRLNTHLINWIESILVVSIGLFCFYFIFMKWLSDIRMCTR